MAPHGVRGNHSATAGGRRQHGEANVSTYANAVAALPRSHLRFQVCLTVTSTSNNRSIFSPRALLSALSCLISSLSLASLALSSSLSLASPALVSIQFMARKTLMAPHAVGGNHSATADGNDGNTMKGVAIFSLPTPSPLLHSPGDTDGFRFAWWS